MKIAVTGATGHLGGLVIRELHARGHEISVLVRGKDLRSLEDIPVNIIEGDLDHKVALTEFTKECDAVIHSAGLISISGDMNGLVHRVNVTGTQNIMEAARQAGVKRVIHVSSVHAYDQHPLDQPLDETRGYAPDHTFAYDRSKRDGQKLALSYASEHMHVMSVNPTSIIGPHDYKPSKLGRAIMEMYTGKLPYVFNGGYDFCDGRDVAAAIVNGLTMGRNGEAYLLGAHWHSLKDLFILISALSGKNKTPMIIPTPLARMGLPFIYLGAKLSGKEPLYTGEAIAAVTEGNLNIVSDKARRELGYTTRPLKETLADTCEWFLKSNY
jgi:dihydroflavonol-4-reductase